METASIVVASPSARNRLSALGGWMFGGKSRRRALSLDDAAVIQAREMYGGQLAPMPQSQPRWYEKDVESAERAANGGDLSKAAQLAAATYSDGTVFGVLSTRTDGLVALRKVFRGDPGITSDLEVGAESVRSTFDEMLPPQELGLLARDGDMIGVGVGEMVPVPQRGFPVLVRLDPTYLRYSWSDNQWFYRSVAGEIAITPGDGRWVLHMPGGRMAPWNNSLWRAVGMAFVRKSAAQSLKANWEAKLANPARVAVSPQGAGEAQAQSWFRSVMAWGSNTVFGVKPGYDVKLIESNGRGWESFDKAIERANVDIQTAIAGQTVTTTGGAGFQNSDIHKTIRADIIKARADALAYTVNTQCLPAYVVARWGVDALKRMSVVEWDTTPPKDRNAESSTLVGAANAIKLLTESLQPYGKTPDVDAICARLGVPLTSVPVEIKAPVLPDKQLRALPGGAQ